MAKIERISFRVNSRQKKQIKLIIQNAGYDSMTEFMLDFLLYKRIDVEEFEELSRRMQRMVEKMKN